MPVTLRRTEQPLLKCCKTKAKTRGKKRTYAQETTETTSSGYQRGKILHWLCVCTEEGPKDCALQISLRFGPVVMSTIATGSRRYKSRKEKVVSLTRKLIVSVRRPPSSQSVMNRIDATNRCQDGGYDVATSVASLGVSENTFCFQYVAVIEAAVIRTTQQ